MLPGDPATATGGFTYDRRMIDGLTASGWEVAVHRLPEDFPLPNRDTVDAAERVLQGIPDNALVLVDGLALGALPEQAQRHGPRLRLVALVHHPLALETGLSADDMRRLRDSERRALAGARRVIVTSPCTAAALSDYGVPSSRVGVVEPGTDPRPQAQGSDGQSLSLLCVAALVPRKGHSELFAALGRLLDRPWRLRCVGSLERRPDTVTDLRQLLRQLDMEQRVELLGEVTEAALDRLYDGTDIFVLASHHEGYGMALAEALAHGLPVVSTRAGAIPDTVPPEASRLVPPGDSPALSGALAALMDDAGLRARLAREARRAGLALPSWEQAARVLAAELARVAP